jgi:ADP-ribose diphosphatase
VSDPEVLLATRLFRVERRIFQTPDGREHIRDTIQHPGAVAILPFLPDGRVCLIRNFRVAVHQTLIELPAGTLEAGEDPLATAHRELAEETGYQAARIEPLCQILMSPGILHERVHIYVANGLTAGPPRLEAGEQIEPLLVDWPAAIQMVESGRIVDGKTVAGLLFYDRLRRSAG